eukprot:2917-Pleurochrysis_carterae.AAC.7
MRVHGAGVDATAGCAQENKAPSAYATVAVYAAVRRRRVRARERSAASRSRCGCAAAPRPV